MGLALGLTLARCGLGERRYKFSEPGTLAVSQRSSDWVDYTGKRHAKHTQAPDTAFPVSDREDSVAYRNSPTESRRSRLATP